MTLIKEESGTSGQGLEDNFFSCSVRSLHDVRERLKTFKDWPFMENCNCTPEKMAEAGFYLIGSSKEPDLVRCFYCSRELDGWEPEDVPWDEHARRECPFIHLNKKPQDLTLEDIFTLQSEKEIANMKNELKNTKRKFEELAIENRQKMTDMVDKGKENKKTRSRRKGKTK